MNATRKRIAIDTYEASDGTYWIFNTQRGWVRVAHDSRAVVAERRVRTLRTLRKRYPDAVARCAKRLDGRGWWATHYLRTH